MLKGLGIESGVRLERIRRDWNSLFDRTISSHISPASLTEKELLLNVDSPAWMQQLTFCKKELIRKLSSYGITDIRFRLGKVKQAGRQSLPPATERDLSEEEVSFIDSVVSDIRDEGLKDSIQKAIRKSFTSTVRTGHRQ